MHQEEEGEGEGERARLRDAFERLQQEHAALAAVHGDMQVGPI